MAERQNTEQTAAESAEELKRYLFFEATEAEREQMEKRFFDDDRLFYDLLDLENDLTDRFALDRLGASDKRRFEKSLEKSPERRAKLANAKALQNFIAEEKPKTEVSAASEKEVKKASLTTKLADFFGLNARKFQYATAALLLLLLFSTGFLLFERQRSARELARLRENENQRIAELQRQETALQTEIKTIREREENLRNQLEGERGQAEILSEQLTREQTEKARLIRELENLKRQRSNAPPENLQKQASAPLVATVVLTPIGGRGEGGGDAAKIISVNQNTRTIFATLQIPKESVAVRFDVQINSAPLAENLKPRATKSGVKFISVSFTPNNLSAKAENLLTATGDDGSRYNYVLRLKK